MVHATQLLLILASLQSLLPPSHALSPFWDPVADPAALVPAGSTRFTVLTPSLIRIQFAEPPGYAFDDRATAVVVNRRLPVPPLPWSAPLPIAWSSQRQRCGWRTTFQRRPPSPGRMAAATRGWAGEWWAASPCPRHPMA